MQPYLAVTEQYIYEWQGEQWSLFTVICCYPGYTVKPQQWAFRLTVPYETICEVLIEHYDGRGHVLATPLWSRVGPLPTGSIQYYELRKPIEK